MSNILNVNQAVDAFINYMTTLRKSKKTIRAYQLDLNAFLKYLQETYGSAVVKSEDFKYIVLNYMDTLNYYINKDGEQVEYASTTLNRKRTVMRVFTQFLDERDYIEENFSHKIKSVGGKSKVKEILTLEEISDIVRICQEDIDSADTPHSKYIAYRNNMMFVIMLYSGIRVSELVALKWINLSIPNRFEKRQGEMLIENGKGGKSREIPIISEFRDELTNYRDFLIALSASENGVDYLGGEVDYIFYTNERNKDIMLTTKTVERVIKSLIERAGIKKNITPHSLRHTMASHLIQSNVTIANLAEILGHYSPTITLSTYTHVISKEQKFKEMSKVSFKQ